jgi:hypothetical protein
VWLRPARLQCPLTQLARPGRITKQSKTARGTGALIDNADDRGRSAESTDRTVECIRAGSVSSVRAMAFMADSARASHIAKKRESMRDLNLTCPFNASDVSPALACKQHRLFPYLRRQRLSHVVFQFGLVNKFEYVVLSRFDEYERLYGRGPERIAHSVVEVQTHRLNPPEYAFLTQDGFHRLMWSNLNWRRNWS